MKSIIQENKGFSLIELLIVIIVIGIAMAIGFQWMGASVDDYRRIKTEREMVLLAAAIVGNSDLHSNGKRSDFGYVGDIGAFPPDLEALYQNPGYFTWDGPYIFSGFTQDSLGYKTDEWGQVYAYTGNIIITSNGGGSTITKKIANASSDYLLNSLEGTITDADDSLPGTIYRDSIDIKVTIPNGFGGTLSKTYNPDSIGLFSLDSLPVGTRRLDIIYIPNNDTLSRFVTILPRHKGTQHYKFADITFPSGGGGTVPGIIKVAGSDSLYADCRGIYFWIENNSGSPIIINSIKLTWVSPTAYYRFVKWDNNTVFDSNSPKAGSGETITLSSPQIINDGSSLKIDFDNFKDFLTGGQDVDMNNTTLTVDFSDGSSVEVTVGACP